MTQQDLEQKLKDLAAATAPAHSLVSRVMDRVSEAQQPRNRRFLQFLTASPVWRAAAAVFAVAAGIAVIVLGMWSLRSPLHPAPFVHVQEESWSDVVVVRVLDIRRIDLRSPDTLDNLLRDSSSAPSRDTAVRVADVSRPDLNLY